jgi:hypothetical protein
MVVTSLKHLYQLRLDARGRSLAHIAGTRWASESTSIWTGFVK